MKPKFRHLLLAVLALLMIAFMQPLMTFLGGLALLTGVGMLIFRDLPPPAQAALEQGLVTLLRRARGGPVLLDQQRQRDAQAATLAVLPPTLSPPKPTNRRSRRRTAPAVEYGSSSPDA